MSHSTLSLNSTGKVRLVGLQDNLGVVQTDALVRLLSLTDRATGDTITGVTLPLTMDHVNGSNGNYEAIVPATIDVSNGQILEGVVEAVGAQGFQKQWTETIRVQKATS